MMMDERANAEAIAAYLFEVATKNMGLSNEAELADRSNRVATTLVALRPEFEAH
jgi:hypothetical protein